MHVNRLLQAIVKPSICNNDAKLMFLKKITARKMGQLMKITH